ncbi:MAG: L-lactate dehydrogenase, partial [Candidatus Altiarchaeales archaeon]|nr:L-lactate dehydrogenase [Candidatus Altiarchaeales archaeon]
VEITETILRDEYSVLPVSTYLADYFGVGDVCLSVPTIINRGGIKKKLKLNLTGREEKLLKQSAAKIRSTLNHVGF